MPDELRRPRAASDAPIRISATDDSYYREHFEASATSLADRGYEQVRPAYMLGHFAAYDPDLAGLEFEEVEAQLEHRWNDEQRMRLGEWQGVRGFARAGYTRGRTFAERLGDLPRHAAEARDQGDRAGTRRDDSRLGGR